MRSGRRETLGPEAELRASMLRSETSRDRHRGSRTPAPTDGGTSARLARGRSTARARLVRDRLSTCRVRATAARNGDRPCAVCSTCQTTARSRLTTRSGCCVCVLLFVWRRVLDRVGVLRGSRFALSGNTQNRDAIVRLCGCSMLARDVRCQCSCVRCGPALARVACSGCQRRIRDV
jgi:hypothetical protein